MLTYLIAAALALIDVTRAPYSARPFDPNDQAPAIQLALADAEARGETVYIPAGEYTLRRNLLLGQGQVVLGAGKTQTTLRRLSPTPDNTAYALQGRPGQAVSNVYIGDLKLTTTDDPNAAVSGIVLGTPGQNNWTVERVHFDSFSNHGLRQAQPTTGLLVSECEFTNIHQIPSASGVSATGIKQAVFINNLCHDSGDGRATQWCFYPSGNCGDLTFIGNRFYNTKSGGIHTACTDGTSANVTIANNSFDGIGTGGTASIAIGGIKNLRIVSNRFTYNIPTSTVRILGDTYGWSVTGNTFDFSGNTSDIAGIYVLGGNTDGRIEHNTFKTDKRTRGSAIAVYGGQRLQIARNTFLNIKTAIRLADAGAGTTAPQDVAINDNEAFLDFAAPDATPGLGEPSAGVHVVRGAVVPTLWPNLWTNYRYETFRP